MSLNPFRQRIMDGEAYFTQGAYAQALQVFEEVLSADPQNADALNDAGLTCAAMDDLPRAAHYFEQALRSDPAHSSAFYGLLDLLIRFGDLELVTEAFAHYEGAIAESEEKRRYREALLSSGDGHGVSVSAYLNPAGAGGKAFEALERFHAELRPRGYVQIGVGAGLALSLAGDDTLCIGIDPAPNVKVPLPPDTRLFAEDVNGFFDRHELGAILQGVPLDLALLQQAPDFEAALQAFTALEHHARPESVILIDVASATARGEVENPLAELIGYLERHRPELLIQPLGADSGLVQISSPDPAATVRLGPPQDASLELSPFAAAR